MTTHPRRRRSPLTRRHLPITRVVALAAAAASAVAVLTAPDAGAIAGLSVAPTTTTRVDPSSTTTLSGLSVSGDASDTLQATIATSVGTITIPSNAGLTLSYNNHWTGDASITFTGSQADIDTALATAQLVSGNNAGKTASITLTAMVSQPGYVYLAPNQHFYQYVAAPGTTWTADNTAAQNLTFNGQHGYLATIPNDTVNNFITSKIQGAQNVWIGAQSTDTPGSPIQRTWKWTGGPLLGQPISYCSNLLNTCDFTNNAGLYSHWASGEPNNYGATNGVPNSGEWVAVTNWNSSNGLWNDLPPSWSGLSQVAGYVVEYGDQVNGSTGFTGVVNTSSSVLIAARPGQPTNVSASRGDGTATITFTAPSTNGSPITSYTLTASPGGATATCPGSPCSFGDLANGTAYTFTAHATNGVGDGPESAPSNSVTPATVPDAPTNVAATSSNGAATVTFDAPAFDGGSAVTGYRATASPGGASATCAGSPCTVEGLTNGTPYTFSVIATNSVGNSVPSTASDSVTPMTVPAAPSTPSVTAGDTTAVVTFAPGDDGGSPITGYRITVQPSGATYDCDGSPCTVDGLANGTAYTFAVQAINSVGLGASSDPSDPVTPAGVPFAPGDLTVDRGDAAATVHFTAADGNGSEVSGYEYSLDGETWYPLDTTAVESGLSGTIGELANGSTYDVRVRAVNAVGDGAPAGPTGVTPARVPDAPTGVAATRAGDGRASVGWTAPAADGGDTITGYTVTSSPDGITATCSASPCIVAGLTNGTSYTFTVHATNSVGDGPESDGSASLTPAVAPDAPTGLRVTSANGALVLSFSAPVNDGGDAIVGYEVSTDGGATWSALTTSGNAPITATVAELVNGTAYEVAVRAVNGVGSGTAGDSVDGTPATVPGAPRTVAVKVVGTTAVVSWTAPASDGGSPITGYVVTAAPGGAQCTATGTSCTVTGLQPGQRYILTVQADNTAAALPGTGLGAGSATPSTLVSGLPTAPRSLTVKGGDRTLTLRFAAPTDDGGSPVTAYQVSLDGGRHWSTLPVKTSSGVLSGTVTGVLDGARYQVAVRAVNRIGHGPATAIRTVTVPAWFRDPVSRTSRAHEVPVPAHPVHYRGRLAWTTARSRSHNGTPAVDVAALHGRQLQRGQAAGLGSDALFGFDSSRLTGAGRSAVKALVRSLRYDASVTCEGYSDYGGVGAHQKALSVARARVVCSALRQYGARVGVRSAGYGGSYPVIVGGRPSDRAANRRVIVLITG